jgi:hypothetical protein
MMENKKLNQEENKADKLPAAGTGNASNPSLEEALQIPTVNQLLDEKASSYIREAGNIEDMPDEKDMEDMDETLRKK